MTKKRKRKIYLKKLSNECYSLDFSFKKWLEERLPIYLRDADKWIDLESSEFDVNGVKMNQKQIILRMIELLSLLRRINNMSGEYDYDVNWSEEMRSQAVRKSLEDETKYTNELLELWKIVFPAMWW